jgi:uncharacterized RDD family membrane protein YckC
MFNFEVNQWFRVLARICDYCLFFLTASVITLVLPFFYGPFFYYYLAIAIPLLWAPLEALLISKWGTTPGKALLGLSVRDAVGFKLPYSLSLKRALFLPSRPGTLLQKKTSWLRKLCAIVTCASFLLFGIYGNVLTFWTMGLNQAISPEDWVQYTSDYAGFKVSFPTNPEESSKELVIPDSGKILSYEELTSAENDKVHYSVTHMEIPRRWRLAGDATLLKGVLDVMVKHTDGAELIEKDFNKFGGYRVLDFRMKQGAEEVKGRLLVVGQTLYKLSIIYPPSHAEKMQASPFLDSFEVSK